MAYDPYQSIGEYVTTDERGYPSRRMTYTAPQVYAMPPELSTSMKAGCRCQEESPSAKWMILVAVAAYLLGRRK